MKRLALACLLLLAMALPAAAQEYPMYTACTSAQAITSAADVLNIDTGANFSVYVWKIWIVPGTQTTAGYHQFVLERTTSASTGGSAITAAPHSPFSSVFTGVAQSGASGGGAAGVVMITGSFWAATATTIGQSNPLILFDATGLTKRDAIYLAPGGTAGLKLHDNTGGAGGANHYACAIFSEEVK